MWYEAHLVDLDSDLNVYAVFVPGVPVPVAGHALVVGSLRCVLCTTNPRFLVFLARIIHNCMILKIILTAEDAESAEKKKAARFKIDNHDIAPIFLY